MSGSLRIFFFVGDLFLLNLSIFFSLFFYGGSFWIGTGVNNIYLLVFSNLAWLFLVMVSTPYSVTKAWALSRIITSQLAFVFIHLLVVVSLIFFFKQGYSIFQISLIYLVFIPAFFGYRIVTLYLRKIFTHENAFKNYVLIGRNELSNGIRKFFLLNPDARYKFQGYLDFDSKSFSITAIQEFCVDKDVHEIYCCMEDVSREGLQQLINYGLDSLIKVKLVASTNHSHQQAIKLGPYDQLPGIDVATIPLDQTKNQIIKRFFDLTFASFFGVFFMSWLFPLIALAIKFDSSGPVFFVQRRSGKDNEPFKCFKFRTMRVNNDADIRQASKEDERITRLGRFLRRTSIDELPQFINVFNGTMSVVGPRPHMLRHTEEYNKLIDRFMGRHYVKPGITGLAQCLGYRGETKELIDMENRVRMDRYYIENWSFWFDVKIIFLTVISLVRGSDKAL